MSFGKSFSGGMSKAGGGAGQSGPGAGHGASGGSGGFGGGPTPATKVLGGMQKDFPHVLNSERLRQAVQDSAGSERRPAIAGGAAAANRKPRLLACVLVSGLSYDLHPFFRRITDELDTLSGSELRFVMINDPGQSGASYLASLDETSRKRVAEDERVFVEEIYKAGKAETHVIRESRASATAVGLTADDLPCIAFAIGGHVDKTVALRLSGYWYKTEQGRHLLGTVLLKELKAGELRSLLEKGLPAPGLLTQMQKIVRHIAREIDGAIFRDRDAALILGEGAGRKRSKRAAVLRINLREGRVFLRGQEIALGRAAFDTLCALVYEPGVHIPRGELYSRVTGSDECVDSSQVSWAKSRMDEIRTALRNAVGKGGLKPDDIDLVVTKDHRLWLNLKPGEVDFE